MLSMDKIARADAERREYLNRICASQRHPGRGHNPNPNKGVELAKLPANWQAIKDAVFKHTKPEYMREFLGTVVACVGARLGVSHTAMAREKKVSAQTILNYVRRQDRHSWPWLRAEVDRVTALVKEQIGAEGKAD